MYVSVFHLRNRKYRKLLGGLKDIIISKICWLEGTRQDKTTVVVIEREETEGIFEVKRRTGLCCKDGIEINNLCNFYTEKELMSHPKAQL